MGWNLPRGTENNLETLQSGYQAPSPNPVPQQYTADPKYITTNKYLSRILITKFSPTCFGRHYGHPQGDVFIQYKNTDVVNRVAVTS